MTIPPQLSRETLSQQIRDWLLEQIVSGEIKPGDRLLVKKIAEEKATSQAPVREALSELEAMGIINTSPNKGARVRVITDKELCQMYDVRAQLEGYAAEVVAQLDLSLTTELTKCIRNMKRVARDGDPIAFAEHNSEFHRITVAATDNQVLLDCWETLNIKTRTMVNVSRSRRDLVALADSHNMIIEVLLSGNPMKARAVVCDHILKNKPLVGTI